MTSRTVTCSGPRSTIASTPVAPVPLAGTLVQEETRPITVHSWSVGVQRELPWRMLADVAYVGNTVAQCVRGQCRASPTPISSTIPLPQLVANPPPGMIDRTTGNVLPTDFIRPNYPGRGGVPAAGLPE